MKYINIFLVGLLFFLMAGCDNESIEDLSTELEAKNKIITELEQTIHSLEQKKQELQKKIEHSEKEAEYFPTISNQSYQFVQAHTSGNPEEIQTLLGNGLNLIEKDNDLYVTFPYSGEEVEVPVYREDSPYIYQDMLIQGFAYVPEEEVYRVYIREFYVDQNHQGVSPPTFLHLAFKRVEDSWKIIEIGFDV